MSNIEIQCRSQDGLQVLLYWAGDISIEGLNNHSDHTDTCSGKEGHRVANSLNNFNSIKGINHVSTTH